ncbi:MAG: hypothetical protein EBR34_12275 [Sphingomonadaceae bacterium]|nr:hypothetical protein [Sphingomonadaceae bacterium]
MEHALLVSFLEGTIPASTFAHAIEQEVEACDAGVRSPANIGYIIVTDGPRFTVTREHMKRLLHSMLDKTVPWASANYTADCLMMSDDFQPESEDVDEAIEFVADDSRPPTDEETRALLERLG